MQEDEKRNIHLIPLLKINACEQICDSLSDTIRPSWESNRRSRHVFWRKKTFGRTVSGHPQSHGTEVESYSFLLTNNTKRVKALFPEKLDNRRLQWQNWWKSLQMLLTMSIWRKCDSLVTFQITGNGTVDEWWTNDTNRKPNRAIVFFLLPTFQGPRYHILEWLHILSAYHFSKTVAKWVYCLVKCTRTKVPYDATTPVASIVT